jgi:glycosyltransferase involved in cell wall biosynthesis
MTRCIALVVPGIEDFGMVSVEAQAAGRPVIGSAAGGTAEIVADGVTGFLVETRTAEGLATAMHRARNERLDPAALVASARRFDTSAFALALERIISETCAANHSSVGSAAG